MSTPLRVLIVENSQDDALLLVQGLRHDGYDPVFERVSTPETFAAALTEQTWDVVIAGYATPRLGGLDALRLLQESDLDLPFIIVSGAVGEEIAVEAMRAGARDYVLKSNLARLAPAVRRELREAETRRARRLAEEAIQRRTAQLEALREVGLELIA
ncbi:MAG: response regulator, partial [Chloroflexi bacterium]|nr:response regulator [Chloroflexota bacterium]